MIRRGTRLNCGNRSNGLYPLKPDAPHLVPYLSLIMRLLYVSITDPSKEKLVTDILHEIEGVEVRRGPEKAKRAVTRKSKPVATGRAKAIKPMTPNEKKFVKGLTQAFKEMDEHIAGKRKLKTLKEVLDEL